MLFNLFVLAFLGNVHADVSVYGSESYITGGYDQFDMSDTLTELNQKRSALGRVPVVYDLKLNIATAIQCEQLANMNYINPKDPRISYALHIYKKMETLERDLRPQDGIIWGLKALHRLKMTDHHMSCVSLTIFILI